MPAKLSQPQVGTVLQAVICQKFKEPFSRTGRVLEVTMQTEGVTVTSDRVKINPNWAVKTGPIEAVQRAIQLCTEYDRRVGEADSLYRTKLKHELQIVLEKIERWGGAQAVHDLISEITNQ